MDLPRISIVTPSLNQAQFLEETIISVLSQGYPNLEYIIMDGGSTDGSAAILSKYSARLAHCESGSDGGQAQAISRGFQMATGEIVAWINSDDVYLPGALLAVGRHFGSAPDSMVLVGGYFEVDEDGRRLDQHLPLRQSFRSLLCYSQRIGQPSTFWRKSLYEAVGGVDCGLSFAMDYDLFLKFARVSRFSYTDRFLSCYRVHPGAKTTRMWADVGLRETKLVQARAGLNGLTWEVRRAEVIASYRRHCLNRVRPVIHNLRAPARFLVRLKRLAGALLRPGQNAPLLDEEE